MAETTVVTTGDEPDPTTSAAAIAGAIAGAAGQKAETAAEDAEKARLGAEAAQGTADAALREGFDKVSREEAARIADERFDAKLAELVAKAKTAEETKPKSDPEPATTEVPKEVLPPSVKKANRESQRRTFADWWHNKEREL